MLAIDFVSPQTPINLTNCDREPIHTPGVIQPYGFLVAINQEGQITRVNETFGSLWAKGDAELIGSHLALIDAQFLPAIQLPSGSEWSVRLKQKNFTARVIATATERYLELQPDLGMQHDARINDIFHRGISLIGGMASVDEIVAHLPGLIKNLTGFDRVMVYRFDADWHGAVASEAKNADLEPFLGLNYPATDIPVQARELYRRNLIRMICDVRYTPVGLITKGEAPPLDLTLSHLRGISPMHIEYLENMKVRATLTISLMVHGQLWGLIACHHYQGTKYLDVGLRQMCGSVGAVASFGISTWLELHRRQVLFTNSQQIETFLGQLAKTRSLVGTLATHAELLLTIGEAHGLCLVENDQVSSWGNCPDKADLLNLANWIRPKLEAEKLYHTHHLRLDYPEASAIKRHASGVVALNLPAHFSSSSHESLLLWLRPEHAETVYWAGNPDKAVKVDATGFVLSPRSSFESWMQKKEHQSSRWSAEVLAGIERFGQAFADFAYEDFKRLAEQSKLRLAQLERLSAIGQLSAGIAHDFNNILLGIQGNSKLIQTTTDVEKQREASEQIKNFCNRGAALVKGLLRHSRGDQQDYVLSDPKELMADLRAFVQTMEGRQFSFELRDLTAEPCQFIGNTNEILQCLFNLINNARDALTGPKGSIEITLKDDPSRSAILFTVKDNGTGIPPHIVERIFDPFFTTKGAGRGTGLGLASVRQIVLNHGGDLVVKSDPGRGTEFTILLPRADAKQSEVTPSKPVVVGQPNELTQQALRVLYVEDEATIRNIYAELFLDAFKEVQTASSAAEALTVFKASTFDLVISDLRMPGMDGMAFYRALRQLNKTVPFLLVTGELMTREEILGQVPDAVFDVLAKPFEIEDVAALYQRLSQAEARASLASESERLRA